MFKPTANAGNNIAKVKKRLVGRFAIIAILTSLIVFVAFSLKLMVEEDNQMAKHLMSFQTIAEKYYRLEQVDVIKVSPNITAYFHSHRLPERLKAHFPYEKNKVIRVNPYSEEGFMVFHSEFIYNQKPVPLYLSINVRSLDFGDDSWDLLLTISTLLMLFLAGVLSISIKQMFVGLMSPVEQLSEQLSDGHRSEFSVPEHTIDEIKHLTRHLNSYTQMKEKLVKQEIMFAKYASHELKTPIAVISGAASLQGMKEGDVAFQAKQRQRIKSAAEGMQSTIEILLNIVKQENVSDSEEVWPIHLDDVLLEDLRKKAKTKVHLELESNTRLNFPHTVLNVIIKNLVSNAIRFTDQGSINITISSHSISVQDTGTGLSDTNETEHGLGLLIVQRLCKAYGWVFELEDNIGSKGCIARLHRP